MDWAHDEARPGRRGLPFYVTIEGEHVVIHLAGEIDIANADLLLPAAVTAVAGDSSLRLDLTSVTFLDAGALRQLLICEACLARDGVDVKLRNVPEHVRHVLEHAQLTHLLERDGLRPPAASNAWLQEPA
jgi:anti-anti-sigma factor